MLIESFQKLAKDIENEWQSLEKKQTAFPSICRKHLENWQVLWSLSEFLKELLCFKFAAYQSFPKNEFAQPPVTVVATEDFHIDVYFWLDTDTAIHNHHFVGAFRPIYGHSIQHSFLFEENKLWEDNVRTGSLSLVKSQKVDLQQAIEINFEDAFIHLVEHLEFPTVTICVRTPPLANSNLSMFYFPGLRLTIDKYLDNKRLLLWKILSETGEDYPIQNVLAQLPMRDVLYSFLSQKKFRDETFGAQANNAISQYVAKHFPEFAFIPVQHKILLDKILSHN